MRLGRSASRCKQRGLHTTLSKQPGKRLTNGVLPKSTGKGHGGAQAGQTTGHIRRRTSQSVVHGPINRRITAWRAKPIDQGFTKTDDNGSKRHPTHQNLT